MPLFLWVIPYIYVHSFIHSFLVSFCVGLMNERNERNELDSYRSLLQLLHALSFFGLSSSYLSRHVGLLFFSLPPLPNPTQSSHSLLSHAHIHMSCLAEIVDGGSGYYTHTHTYIHTYILRRICIRTIRYDFSLQVSIGTYTVMKTRQGTKRKNK